MRWLTIVHQLPDRTRLRSPVIRHDDTACQRIADALATTAGVRQVRLRPYTDSIVVEHDETVPAERLVDVIRSAVEIDHVVPRGEKPPRDQAVPPFSLIAREVVTAARKIDRDLRRHTEGHVDLGVLATLGFLAAGAVEVATTEDLPMPPWFNLAWWSYRTFMTTHATEVFDDKKAVG